MEHRVVVHPGESRAANFLPQHHRHMIGQAIPNVLPNNAADYFTKQPVFVLTISHWLQGTG